MKIYQVKGENYVEGGYVFGGDITVAVYSDRKSAEAHVAQYRHVIGTQKGLPYVKMDDRERDALADALRKERLFLLACETFDEYPDRLYVVETDVQDTFTPFNKADWEAVRYAKSLAPWHDRCFSADRSTARYRALVRLNEDLALHRMDKDGVAKARVLVADMDYFEWKWTSRGLEICEM